MAKGKKYDFNLVLVDGSWTAEIVRKITSKKTVVSKSQADFASEAEAQVWAETELKGFLQNQIDRNARRIRLVSESVEDNAAESAEDRAEESDESEEDDA
ncbi:MAG: L-cysteine desulfidase [Moritella dasanensis]|jgi:L-cysteine desulfidase